MPAFLAGLNCLAFLPPGSPAPFNMKLLVRHALEEEQALRRRQRNARIAGINATSRRKPPCGLRMGKPSRKNNGSIFCLLFCCLIETVAAKRHLLHRVIVSDRQELTRAGPFS